MSEIVVCVRNLADPSALDPYRPYVSISDPSPPSRNMSDQDLIKWHKQILEAARRDSEGICVYVDDTMKAWQLMDLLYREKFLLPIGLYHFPVLYNLIREDAPPVQYYFRDLSLADAHISSGDELFVSRTAQIPRGPGLGVLDYFAIAASVASIAQLILMVVDMWSRRAKERNVDKTNPLFVEAAKSDTSTSPYRVEKRAWNEVKKIQVLTSDGNRVQFDSWLADPQAVKNFLRVFDHSPSLHQTVPIRVVFFLENGSRLALNVREWPTEREERLRAAQADGQKPRIIWAHLEESGLDKFIEYLNLPSVPEKADVDTMPMAEKEDKVTPSPFFRLLEDLEEESDV